MRTAERWTTNMNQELKYLFMHFGDLGHGCNKHWMAEWNRTHINKYNAISKRLPIEHVQYSDVLAVNIATQHFIRKKGIERMNARERYCNATVR